MVWDCVSCFESYGGPPLDRENDMLGMIRLPEEMLDVNVNSKKLIAKELYHKWKRVIEFYSKRSLSELSDRLPAISGVATKFGAQLIDHVYVAGFWYLPSLSTLFLDSLLWARNDRVGPFPMQVHAATLYESLAPSWSWVSLAAGVYYLEETPTEAMCEVLSCTVTLLSHHRLGGIRDGTLVIQAPAKLIKAEFDGHFLVEKSTDTTSVKSAKFISGQVDKPTDFEIGTLIGVLCVRLTEKGGLCLRDLGNGVYKRISSVWAMDAKHFSAWYYMSTISFNIFFKGRENRTITIV